jgi:pseudaminic acid synthase
MKILNRTISNDNPPFLIAEMSGNHGGNLERALKLVELAADCGCDAIKLQTFSLDEMTMDIDRDEFKVLAVNSPWNGSHLYNLYKMAELPREWHEPIIEKSKQHGIICFSSVFDINSLHFLESLDALAYKIASCEIGDLRLIEEVAKTLKPIFISTGMATLSEIEDAVSLIAQIHGSVENLCIFKCTTDYPAKPKDSNVSTIKYLRDLFGAEVGLSDHTMGIGVATLSIAFGATVIEKHFVDVRDEAAIDSRFSMLPDEMKQLRKELNSAWQAVGKTCFGPSESEKVNLKYKRSLYFKKDLKSGDVITEQDIISIRPAFGLEPKFWKNIIGLKLSKNVNRGDPVSFSAF